MVLLNRRREMGKHLPYDYEVEWIRSSGQSIILLPFRFNSLNIKVLIKGIFRTESGGTYTVAYRTDNKPWNLNVTTRLLQTDGNYDVYTQLYGNTQVSFHMSRTGVLELEHGNFYVKDVNSGNYYLKGTRVTTIKQGNNSPQMQIGKSTIYYITYIQDDVIICDLIPVVDKQGVGCMYDKVSKQLFYNAGTGQFIVGPRITSGGGYKCLVINTLCGYSAERRAA